MLLTAPRSGLKKDVGFLFVSHTAVGVAGIRRALRTLPDETVWFRFEPMILRVACATLPDALVLLGTAQRLFKHSGIISLTPQRAMLEIRGSEFIEAPVAVGEKLAVPETYFRLLVKESNRKLRLTHKKVDQLCATLAAKR